MSIDLPEELVWALVLIGLPWPQIEEDQLREYAAHLRSYASSLIETHESAHGTIRGLSVENFGSSIETLVDRWGRASSSHLHKLADGCQAFATALEMAAEGVVTAKLGIIAALAAMVAETVADQGASVATLGLAEAAEVAIVAGTRFIVKKLLETLEQLAITEGLQLALSPLESKLEESVQGLVLHGMGNALAS